MRYLARGFQWVKTTISKQRPYDVALLDTFASATLKEQGPDDILRFFLMLKKNFSEDIIITFQLSMLKDYAPPPKKKQEGNC